MFDTNLWNTTTAESGFAENETPAPGLYTVCITEGKFALTGENKSTPTIIVEYRTADGKQWADVKTLTTEGRVKSAKILLRDLGLDPEALNTQEAIHAGLKSIEGTYFDVQTKDSATLNKATGQPYRNTSIVGRTQATQPPSPAPIAAQTATDDLPF